MAIRKRTIRRMPPITRKYVRAINQLQSSIVRLKNLIPVIQELEFSARAEHERERLSTASPNAELFIQEKIEGQH